MTWTGDSDDSPVVSSPTPSIITSTPAFDRFVTSKAAIQQQQHQQQLSAPRFAPSFVFPPSSTSNVPMPAATSAGTFGASTSFFRAPATTAAASSLSSSSRVGSILPTSSVRPSFGFQALRPRSSTVVERLEMAADDYFGSDDDAAFEAALGEVVGSGKSSFC